MLKPSSSTISCVFRINTSPYDLFLTIYIDPSTPHRTRPVSVLHKKLPARRLTPNPVSANSSLALRPKMKGPKVARLSISDVEMRTGVG